MQKTTLLAAAAVFFAVTASAQAGSFDKPCTTAPQSSWLPIEQLQAKVETLGYKVKKAKFKNACGEIYAIDKDGNRAELFVDPTTGQIVGQL